MYITFWVDCFISNHTVKVGLLKDKITFSGNAEPSQTKLTLKIVNTISMKTKKHLHYWRTPHVKYMDVNLKQYIYSIEMPSKR
jgi:hypothetical protein